MSIAHLGHVEIRVTDLQASKRFFTELYGLFVSAETENQVYLRAWQDYEHHTLILTQADVPGVEHISWRVERPEALREMEKRLKSLGVPLKWVEGGTEIGQGDAIRFLTPAGIPMELYWEMEKYKAPAEMASVYASHPQKYTGRGAAPRRFDHLATLVEGVEAEQEWITEVLGIKHRYYIEGSDGRRVGSWMSKTNLSHEIALIRNRRQNGTYLHHISYYVDNPAELMRAATIMSENGIKIEWGPGKHGTSGAIFLYMFEPSGNRVELWTGGLLCFAPDWEPQRWDASTGFFGLNSWGTPPPESYLNYATPAAKEI